MSSDVLRFATSKKPTKNLRLGARVVEKGGGGK